MYELSQAQKVALLVNALPRLDSATVDTLYAELTSAQQRSLDALRTQLEQLDLTQPYAPPTVAENLCVQFRAFHNVPTRTRKEAAEAGVALPEYAQVAWVQMALNYYNGNELDPKGSPYPYVKVALDRLFAAYDGEWGGVLSQLTGHRSLARHEYQELLVKTYDDQQHPQWARVLVLVELHKLHHYL